LSIREAVMVAYSIDLRQRVLMALDAGEGSQEQVARRFSVSARWIRKLLAQRAKTGSIAPKPRAGGRKRLIQGEHAESLRAAVDETPDATLGELREAIGFGGCLMTVWRSLRRLRITRKKSRCGLGSNSIRRSSSNVGTGGSGRRMSTRAGSSSSTRATPRRP
jgi:transposase